MILSCNSCEKKFVVPDAAISASGRTVQCGSCGNKWKQFPINNQKNKDQLIKKISSNKTKTIKPNKITKPKKKRVSQTKEISLYSPEYLKKKHGISISNINSDIKTSSVKKVSFGFYNSIIIFIVVVITFSKGLHFFQEFIVETLPFTEFYLNYFFESINNIFAIWKNLISNY
mgnify:CR=1 FL=1